MLTRVSGAAQGEIQKLLDWGAIGTCTDSQLIERFLAGEEESEAAFRVLIQRHGPMVLGICRRILRDEHAAEDAFQATFLVLVEKAERLRDRDLLTNWLYGVASRVSQKERARAERRRAVERNAADRGPRDTAGPEPAELGSVIDEEIRRLPERYRLPLLLCHVEGLRHDEVARRLGCPVGTVESRLSRARGQLRTRLARRGLAPSASAMSAMLRPPGARVVPSALVESTLQATLPRLASKFSLPAAIHAVLGRAGLAVAEVRSGAGATAAGLVVCLGITAVGLGLSMAREPGPAPSPNSGPGPRPSPPTPVAAITTPPAEPPEPSRTPRAIARPMSGITIDGRLDDWPRGLPRYRIRQLLTDQKAVYRPELRQDRTDLVADFRVGYDPRAGLIYLAVEVQDDQHVTRGPGRKGPVGDVFQTDSVEVYIDGTFSDRKIAMPTGGWRDELDAATMPVLQYVGIADEGAAYGDPRGANPSLVYARTGEPRTRMRYRRDETAKLTTYEWAIQAYDRFPDRPTRLMAGRRVGFEVAVMDKDSGQSKPAFVTWGSPRGVFKGCDAGSLGELYLEEGP